MRKVEDVLRLKWGAGLSAREISKAVGIGRTTVSEYLARAEAAGITWPLPEGMDAAELERRLFKARGQGAKHAHAQPDFPTVHRELRGKGVTLFLLWQEYREGYPEGYSYSQFCERYARWKGHLDVVMRQMWLPRGSFWTQPKGEVHITAAKGSANVAYIEIEQGPYLVLPTEEAFDSGERPVNVDASNIVWIDQPGIPAAADGAKVSFLWGNPQDDQLNGTLVKLPAGFTGKIDSHGSTFRAVVIKGQPQYQMPGETDVKTLEPGSNFSSRGSRCIRSRPKREKRASSTYVRMASTTSFRRSNRARFA